MQGLGRGYPLQRRSSWFDGGQLDIAAYHIPIQPLRKRYFGRRGWIEYETSSICKAQVGNIRCKEDGADLVMGLVLGFPRLPHTYSTTAQEMLRLKTLDSFSMMDNKKDSGMRYLSEERWA